MNARIILLLIGTALYFLGANWFYGNKIAGICCGPDKAAAVAATVAPVETKKADFPLMFDWEKPAAIAGTGWATYKANLLKNMTEDNTLEITGHYFKDEAAPEGFANMGLARATAIRDLLKKDIPEARILINGKLVADAADMKTNRFEGSSFNWIAAVKKEETTIVEVDDRILIFYPFNSSVKDSNSQVDEYLQKLAERMKQTSESVSITGHTDNVGDDISNMKLGMNRARSIQDILVKLGVDASRITIDSKGESQPSATNDTEGGRQKNRRAVLQLKK